MKKFLQSYFSFSRTEKNGFVALCAVVVILVVVRATMSLWVHPAIDVEKEKQIVAAWETYKHAQDDNNSIAKTAAFHDTADQPTAAAPDVVDINTADSVTLILLKGIGPVTAHKIILRRKTKGPFTRISQLWETGRFSAATKEELQKHIAFTSPAKR